MMLVKPTKQYCRYCKDVLTKEEFYHNLCHAEVEKYLSSLPKPIVFDFHEGKENYWIELEKNKFEFIADHDDRFSLFTHIEPERFLTELEIKEVQKKFDYKKFVMTFHHLENNPSTSDIKFLGVYITERQTIIKGIATFL